MALDQVIDTLKQCFQINGLCQVINPGVVQFFGALGQIIRRADDQHGQRAKARVGAQRCQQFPAALPWQPQIKQQHFWRRCFDQWDDQFWRGCGNDAKVGLLHQDSFQDIKQLDFIIHHQGESGVGS